MYRGFACAPTRTTLQTHDLIRAHLDRSPLFTGVIEGVGPRYCPSIEDKVVRFPDRDSHPVFLEPVSSSHREVYAQNLSTSLPYDVQVALVRTLPGCERAKILKPGYAIEYDYLPPTQLEPWLETRRVKGLFCAGADQRHLRVRGGRRPRGSWRGSTRPSPPGGRTRWCWGGRRPTWGCWVDDLVTKGTREPYRMLTSRCEHRLLLRHDNADRRLAPLGRRLGLLDDPSWEQLRGRWTRQEELRRRLESHRVVPSDRVRSLLRSWDTPPPEEPVVALELLRRPQITWERLEELCGLEADREEAQSVAVEVKYEGYVRRQERICARMERFDQVALPEGFDFGSVEGLLTESRTKLERIRPRTLGQAGRISGVTPADLELLWATLEARRRGSRG